MPPVGALNFRSFDCSAPQARKVPEIAIFFLTGGRFRVSLDKHGRSSHRDDHLRPLFTFSRGMPGTVRADAEVSTDPIRSATRMSERSG
jgi:hypothetical protein